jgi:hypothetical protein
MDTLQILRGNDEPVWNIKLDNDSNQVKQIMGDNVLTLHFFLSNYVDFKIGDYCTAFDEVYKFYELPVIQKKASNDFEYNVSLKSEGYDLSKAQYLFLGPDNTLRVSEFYLTGNAETFIDLLIANINRISSGWEKGEVIVTDYKNIGFKQDNCYGVLGKLATEFNTEFWIEGKKINLVKKSRNTGFKFEVGYNKGLYEITRVNIDSTRVITRLYAFGSSKNIPSGYEGAYLFGTEPRLHLPPKPSHGNNCLISDITWFEYTDQAAYLQFNWKKPLDPGVTSIEMVYGDTGSGLFDWSQTFGLTGGPMMIGFNYDFEVKFISHGGACEGQETDVIRVTGANLQPIFPTEPVIYIERNVDKYGIIEETTLFDDIYPHRTGTVSSVDASNPNVIVDTSIDFDLAAYLQPGLTAKISFLTGQLGGYTFDISTWDNGTKRITFLKNKNEQNLDVPSSLIKPEIGDQYVLIDITMPTEYVKQAEDDLLAKAQEVLETYSTPQFTINAVMDTRYMKSYNKELFIGDTVWFKDTQLEVDRKIRISQVTRNLVEPFSFQITLADVIAAGKVDSIIQNIDSNSSAISRVSGNVSSRDVINGKMVLPTHPGGAGFEPVIVETATNKLYRQE